MPSFITKLVTRKKKHPQQFRRGSKTFRRNKKLRQNISAKKLYTKGKQFRGGDTVHEVCSICLDILDDTNNNKPIIDTDCSPISHRFHTQCLKGWYLMSLLKSKEDELNFKISCPNCRFSPCVNASLLIPNKEEDKDWQIMVDEKAELAVARAAMEAAERARVEAQDEAERAQVEAERRRKQWERLERFIGQGLTFAEHRDVWIGVGRATRATATRVAMAARQLGRW